MHNCTRYSSEAVALYRHRDCDMTKMIHFKTIGHLQDCPMLGCLHWKTKSLHERCTDEVVTLKYMLALGSACLAPSCSRLLALALGVGLLAEPGRVAKFPAAIVKHFCFRRDLQSSTAAVVSGPWEKHFHPTTPGHKAHSTFWQQRLAKYTNILRTSLTNGVAISKSY
jgi:hypothetical protein